MGRRQIARSVFIHLLSLQAASLAFIAWAGADRGREPRESIGAARQLAHTENRTTVRGELRCTLSEPNNGQACPLQLVNTETGALLNIAGSTSAMRLFQNGKTRVVATGEIQGDRMRIISIQAE